MSSEILVAFLNVGQGDANVIVLPDQISAIVVDCYKSQITLDYLEEQGIEMLSGVFLTHSDADHTDGMAALLQNFSDHLGTIDSIHYNHDTLNIDRGKRRVILRQMAQLARRQGIKTSSPRTGDSYSFGRLHLEVLHPTDLDIKQTAPSNDRNNSSLVLMCTFAGKRVLLTGDLAAKGWKWVVERKTDLKADILKFPHHGAWYNVEEAHSLQQILEQVKPSLVVISVGARNRYGHPNAKTLALLHSSPDLCFLCTQATKQCFPNLDDTQRNPPCAGTIEVRINEHGMKIAPQFTPCRNQLEMSKS